MPRYYTVQETADILGFSTNSVYKFLGEKRLKGTRGNSQQGRFRIPHSSIEHFLGTTLSEEAVTRALHAKKRHDVQTANTPLVIPGSVTHREVSIPTDEPVAPKSASVSMVRILLLVALVLLFIEVATTASISWISIGARVVILGILFVIAYQHGGLTSTKL